MGGVPEVMDDFTADEAVLGLDLGTGSVKALLLDRDGRTLDERSTAYPMSTSAPGVAEVEVDAWWRGVVAAVRALLAHRPVAVAAIGLAGQMHGVVLVDGRLEALAPAVTWADARSPETVREVADLAAPFMASLANPIVPGMAAVTLRWFRRHEPALLGRARRALQPKDWLGGRLTGEAVTDPTDASATLLWDVPCSGWHSGLLRRLDIDAALLPEVAPSDAVRGQLTTDAARDLGIPAGTPVTVGRADTAAALVGSGAAGPGATQLSVGTGGQVCRVLSAFRADPSLRTHRYCGPAAGQWYAMGAILSAGLSLEWVRRALDVTWSQFYDQAFSCPPGARGVTFLPYLAGERTPHLDPSLTGGWHGLRLHHGRPEMLRAALEGCAFALRDASDAVAVPGDPSPVLTLAGGGTLDHRWRQLLADVLERPLVVAPHGGGSGRGAALSAAVAAGWFGDLASAIGSAGEPAPVAEPGPASGSYAEPLVRFRELARLAVASGALA
jgi:xylulokinase